MAPRIYPLTIALLAATSEEFWFRLFAIPLLKRYLRSTWIAVLIPAFIWGFLHANYPQQPGYIRGIEVGVVGVAAGFLMLRFGILATLIWHYAVDAVMIGTFLIRSESLYFQFSGWLVAFAVLFPLLASLGFYWKHSGFLADSGIRNAGAEPAPPVPERQEAEQAGEPVAPAWPSKWLYRTAIAAGAIGLLVHTTPFGAFIRVKMSRCGAEAAASRVLKNRVPDLGSWKVAGEFIPNLESADFEYVRRHDGVRKANEVVRDYTAAGLWRVRFFKPLQKEEWRVLLDREGRVYSVDHLLDEKARGANLTAQQAQEIARNYLERQQKMSPDTYRLVDSTSDKKENRTDYTFVWEDSSFQLAEAKARASLDVQGDEPSHFRRFLKLPEEWLREFEKPRLARIAIPGALGAVGLLLLVIFVKRLGARTADGEPAHRYHWRSYLAVAGSGVLLGVLSSLNRWPEMLSSYDTAEPFQSHVIQFILGRLMLILLVGLALFLVVLAADVFLQLATGNRRLPRASFGRAAGVLALVWGVARILTVAYQYVPGPRLSLPLWSLPGIETYAPAVAVLSTAFVSAVLVLCAAVVVVSAARQYLNARTQGAMAAVAGLIYAVSRAQNIPQFIYFFLLILFWIWILLVLVRVCASDLVTFGVALFWLYACGPAADLIRQPAAWIRGNGIMALGLALAAGTLVLLRFRRESTVT